MLYCTILYHTILYYTILYYTILHYTLLYYTVISFVVLGVGVFTGGLNATAAGGSCAQCQSKVNHVMAQYDRSVALTKRRT